MKKEIIILFFISAVVMFSCTNASENSKEGVFKKVQSLVSDGKCDEALTHFSSRVREKVQNRITNGGNISDWCKGWEISEEELNEALKEINSGKYNSFIEENGIWKIDDL